MQSRTVVSRRSARARIEPGIAYVVAAMRGVVLVQILLTASAGATLAASSSAYTGLTGCVVVVSLVLLIQCLRTGCVRAGVWQLPDIALAWAAIPIMHVLLPASSVVGTWEAWAAGFAMNVAAIAAAWMGRPVLAVIHAVALGGWCFVWTFAAGQVSWETCANNALSVPGYTIVTALMVHYLRWLAVEVDRWHDEAVAATRALELERYQLTVHDASSILRLLSDEQTPASVLPGLRRQGHREARRLRHYLGGHTQPAPDTSSRTVGTVIATALEGFEDLPLELAVDLGAHVELNDDVWGATRAAVTTILHNVRLHADAQQVVIHADTQDAGWEIVVSDNGVGFDQTHQRFGFGLDKLVTQALTRLGVDVEIISSPARGTSITITGSTSSPPAKRHGT